LEHLSKDGVVVNTGEAVVVEGDERESTYPYAKKAKKSEKKVESNKTK
jgi:hypothetical protein